MACEGGLISRICPDIQPQPDDRVLDARGMPILPPFVNGHTHAAMTLFRSFRDDLPLMRWLEEAVWPAERRPCEEDVYWGTRLAAIEMIRSGTTHFFDMYWHGTAVARAARDAGIRATVSAVLIETGDVGELREEATRSLAEIEEIGGTVYPSLGPHAIYTVGPEMLEWCAGLAEERNVPVHIHLSETRDEVEECLRRHGAKPAELLDRVGILGERALLAHGCWLDDDELDLVASRGATVVTNPTSNLKLATGRHFPYARAVERGVRVGLGTDGPASNNSLDMGEAAKVFALVQKFEHRNTSLLPPDEVLAVARGQRSPLLGGDRIREGAKADFILVDTRTPELTPGDLEGNLVFASASRCVDTVVVAGRVLMTGGKVSDEDAVLEEVRARAARLRSA